MAFDQTIKTIVSITNWTAGKLFYVEIARKADSLTILLKMQTINWR